jgi:hypothetical protein
MTFALYRPTQSAATPGQGRWNASETDSRRWLSDWFDGVWLISRSSPRLAQARSATAGENKSAEFQRIKVRTLEAFLCKIVITDAK